MYRRPELVVLGTSILRFQGENIAQLFSVYVLLLASNCITFTSFLRSFILSIELQRLLLTSETR